jgi:hypothetical protein
MTIQGSSIQDQLGESVSKAGDVNGDGIDDVIVGAPDADTANNLDGGKAYVVFGSKSLPGRVYVSALSGRLVLPFVVHPRMDTSVWQSHWQET